MARGGIANAREVLLRQLRAYAAPWTPERMGHLGVVYRGPAGFVVEHGEWFEPRPSPVEYPLGERGRCFGNAIILAAKLGLDYVEGYAVDPGRARVAIHHAWNVDADGGLVDSTWAGTVAVAVGSKTAVMRGMPGLAYLGVRFSVERADDCTWNGDASVLDDHHRGWPLLRERWEGEPEGLVWPPSERLDRIRRLGFRAERFPTIARIR